MNYKEINKKIWNKKVEDNFIWTQAVTSDQVQQARKGNWDIVLTPTKAVPENWFPKDLRRKKYYV